MWLLAVSFRLLWCDCCCCGIVIGRADKRLACQAYKVMVTNDHMLVKGRRSVVVVSDLCCCCCGFVVVVECCCLATTDLSLLLYNFLVSVGTQP